MTRLYFSAIALSLIVVITTGTTGVVTAYAQDATPTFSSLNDKGNVAHAKGLYQEALDSFMEALAAAQIAHDNVGIEYATGNIGLTYSDLGQFDKALECDQQAETEAVQAGDTKEQEFCLSNIGYVNRRLTQYSAALSNDLTWQQLAVRVADTNQQARALHCIGIDYEDLDQYDKATDYDQQALSVATTIADTQQQEAILQDISVACVAGNHYDQGLAYLEKYLAVATTNNDTTGIEKGLIGLAAGYTEMGDYSKALNYNQQYLAFEIKSNNLAGQENAYSQIGQTQIDLGRYDLALTDFNLAVTMSTLLINDRNKCADLFYEAICSSAVGNESDSKSEFQAASDLVKKMQSQAEEKGAKNPYSTEDISSLQERLSLIGRVLGIAVSLPGGLRATPNPDAFKKLGSLVTEYQASKVRPVSGSDTAASMLLANGEILLGQGEYSDAIPPLLNAYQSLKTLDIKDAEANALSDLMNCESHLGQGSLAAYYGKQCINVYQSIRADVATLDASTQKTYLAKIQKSYRQLADILIDQGRLPEAEQVLGMLKDQEEIDYVERSASASPSSESVDLTTKEQAAQSQDDKLSEPVITLGEQIDELQRLQNPTKDQAAQLAKLQGQLQPHEVDYQTFVNDELPKELADSTVDQKGQQAQIQDAEGALQTDLQNMGEGTVALFTLVEPDKYRVVVVTSQTEKAEEYVYPKGFTSADLRKLVLDWRSALTNPHVDPRPLGEQLYKIVVGPVEADLVQAHAKVVMWSLDDVLRYVPIAALYDGKHYMVESYQNEVFTGASVAGLGNAPVSQSWRVLALGVSKPHDVKDPETDQMLDFDGLGGVPAEIAGIISGPKDTGTLPGDAYIDSDFTQAEMLTDLNLKYPVVHIASHFYFGKDYKSSFLLLGDGSPFTLDNVATSAKIFQNVDLLTLSACETAMAGVGGDGHEVESFGMLAQRKGASSILASLWPVADTSTQLLMDDFYRFHGTGSSAISKAAALQKAQLDLLNGTVDLGADPSAGKRDISAADDDSANTNTLPAYPTNLPKFSHPYYWAPFVLIGNWK